MTDVSDSLPSSLPVLVVECLIQSTCNSRLDSLTCLPPNSRQQRASFCACRCHCLRRRRRCCCRRCLCWMPRTLYCGINVSVSSTAQFCYDLKKQKTKQNKNEFFLLNFFNLFFNDDSLVCLWHFRLHNLSPVYPITVRQCLISVSASFDAMLFNSLIKVPEQSPYWSWLLHGRRRTVYLLCQCLTVSVSRRFTVVTLQCLDVSLW